MSDEIEDVPQDDLSVVKTGEYVGGAKFNSEGKRYQFAPAEITEDDKKCALLLRRGLGVGEAIKGAYGELNEVEARKYRKRADRGWYNKIRMSDIPDTIKMDVRNMEVVTLRGDGIEERRQMTEKEMAEFIWKRSASVRVLTEVAENPEAKNMEKIAAVKELNAMHGYYAPATVNVNIGLEDIVREVAERKRTFIMGKKYGAQGDEEVYELSEDDIEVSTHSQSGGDDAVRT